MWCFANALADPKTPLLILPNRTQSPPTTQTIMLTTFTDFFDGGSKYSFYICQYLSSQNKAH
jgi:hypothetical protein